MSGKKRNRNPSSYETYALADKKKITPEINTSTPAEVQVREAKDWVDENRL